METYQRMEIMVISRTGNYGARAKMKFWRNESPGRQAKSTWCQVVNECVHSLVTMTLYGVGDATDIAIVGH